jgi:hypothetical protein
MLIVCTCFVSHVMVVFLQVLFQGGKHENCWVPDLHCVGDGAEFLKHNLRSKFKSLLGHVWLGTIM